MFGKKMINKITSNPKMHSVMNLLNIETGKKDFFYVLAFYAVGVLVYFIIGNFPKAIATYGDELLYFTIGQSIHDGKGIMCMNAPTDFKKVIYSLLLAPFFNIEDAILRVKLINLFNCMLMMSSVILIYFIVKELKLKRGGVILALLITLLWPDMTYSISFMAENFNWPFTLLFILLWIKGKKSDYVIRYSALLGCMCYIGYLGKDIFLAVVLSYVVFEISYPFLMFLLYRKEEKCKFKEFYSRRRIIGVVIFVLCFLICYFVGNNILYGGADSNFSNAVMSGFSRLTDKYNIMYTLYAFIYYIAAVLTATFILPIVCSILNFKKMDKQYQMFFAFILLYLIVSCAMIAYTISSVEDIGRIIPRVHFRYIGSIMLLIIIGFLRILQDKLNFNKSEKQLRLFVTLTAVVVVSLIFKGIIEGSTADHSVLNTYQMVSSTFGSISIYEGGLVVYPYVLIVLLFIAIMIIVVHCCYTHCFNKTAAILFTAIIVGCSVSDIYLENNQYRVSYAVEDARIDSIISINKWLKEKNNKRILYLTENPFCIGHKTIMTYFNFNQYLYSVTSEAVLFNANEGIVSVPDTHFCTSIWNNEYEQIDGFDYILTDETVQNKFQNVSLVEEVSNDYFKLYKNIDPEIIQIYPKDYWDEHLDIDFTVENSNANKFNISGMSHPEPGFAWTNGDAVKFDIPVYGDYDYFNVSIEVVGTFAGEQSYIVMQNGKQIAEGALSGVGKIEFNAEIIDDMLTFDVLCPDALVVREVIESTDGRKVAFQFKGMTVDSGFPDDYWKDHLDIDFTVENSNVDKFNVYGMSHPEPGFTWTDGNMVQFEIPIYGDYDNLDVSIKVIGTFAGEQSYIVMQNDKQIVKGVLSGTGEITFNAEVVDDMLTFDVLCPDALVVNEVIESTDVRKVAFQFSKLTIDSH